MEPPVDGAEGNIVTADVIAGTLSFILLFMDVDSSSRPLEIPLFHRPFHFEAHGSSAWARSYRIDLESDSGEDESYFMKVKAAFAPLIVAVIRYNGGIADI